MSRSKVDVVIVGAGPYGLSLASYLSDSGVERRIFGVPMRAWRDMPPGMNLKSFGFATNIPCLRPHYTLPEYCRERGLEDFEPISFTTFSEYGEWFQQQLVPDVETTLVSRIDRQSDGFEVTLELRGRPPRAARHRCGGPELLHANTRHAQGAARGVRDPRFGHIEIPRDGQYAGRDIAVIGAGQTALEAAALLHEGGARVQILARRDVWWSDPFSERSLRNKLLNPNTVVGPGTEELGAPASALAARTTCPPSAACRLARTLSRSTRRVVAAPPGRRQDSDRAPDHSAVRRIEDNRVALRFRAGQDETLIRADHIISATGYEADCRSAAVYQPEARSAKSRASSARPSCPPRSNRRCRACTSWDPWRPSASARSSASSPAQRSPFHASHGTS